MTDSTEKEWERLAAMIAEAKRHEEIANAQRMFEPVYRDIKRIQRSAKRKETKQSIEEVAIARGIIKILQPEAERKE